MAYQNGGQAELYGGSHGTFEPAFEFGGSSGSLNYYSTGSYQRNDTGISSPDGRPVPLHDRTAQLEGLVYLDRLLGSQDRLSLIVSASDERFQLPDTLGLSSTTAQLGDTFTRPLATGGMTSVASEALDANSREINQFAVASLLHTTDKFTLQIAGFVRHSVALLDRAGIAQLLFYGNGRSSRDTADSFGAQVEAAFDLSEAHTLRGGIVETSIVQNGASALQALPVDALGRESSPTIISFNDTNRLQRRTDSLFVQDEWRVSDFVTINVGARVDHVTDDSGQTAVSPRASAVWHLASDTIVHIGYARYFLPAPFEDVGENPAEVAATTARTPSLSGNPVKAEIDNYYDVGVQRKIGNLTIGADAYWREANNLLDDVQIAASYQTITFNYGHGRVQGGELSATYSDKRFSTWLNLALASAQGRGIVSNEYYFTPTVLAYSATHDVPTSGAQRFTASGGLSYRWNRFRLSGDFLMGSGSARTAPGGVPDGDRESPYAQLNISGVWRLTSFHGRPFDIRFDMINALDAKYQLRDGTGLVPGPVRWGPRRGLFAGVEQNF